MSHHRGRRSGGVRDEIIHHITRAVEDSFHDKRPRSESRHRSRELYRPQQSYSLTPPPVDRRVHRYSSRRRDHTTSPSPDRSRSRSLSYAEQKKLEQAAIAAVDAGAIAAIRSRHNPGSWAGEKGIRVATAALSAAAIDAFLAKNPEVKATRHVLESTIAGLIVNRLVNGSRDR